MRWRTFWTIWASMLTTESYWTPCQCATAGKRQHRAPDSETRWDHQLEKGDSSSASQGRAGDDAGLLPGVFWHGSRFVWSSLPALRQSGQLAGGTASFGLGSQGCPANDIEKQPQAGEGRLLEASRARAMIAN